MQSEFMTAAGFRLIATIGVGTWNVWHGHDLEVTLESTTMNPYQIVRGIIDAQRIKMYTENRAHLSAIVGPLAQY